MHDRPITDCNRRAEVAYPPLAPKARPRGRARPLLTGSARAKKA